MIRGVLLAAGRGSRFGADKLMQPLSNGQTVATTSARTLISRLPTSIAVCRPEQHALREQLAELGFQVEICDQADQGMGYTLASAVAAAEDQADLLVALADMPFIRPETLQKLLIPLQAGADLIQPRYNQTPGNPVGINHRFREQLLQPSGDFGARQLLKQHRNQITYVDVDDPGVLQDIDRPEDLPGTEDC